MSDDGRQRRTRRGQGRGQGLLTILFTDIENSTALTQELGDSRAQAEVVRVHNDIVRRALTARGGSEIKHTGDGIMATFLSATAAVSCAIAIREASAKHNRAEPDRAFNIRIGINAGEPVAEEDDVYGTAVQLAARICDQAGPGQILVSDVVRQLVAGKGLVFDGRGAVELKGFDDAVTVYEVDAEANVGERLWQDAQEQQGGSGGRPWFLGPLFVTGAAVAVAIAAGVVIAVLLLSGGDGDSAIRPDYRVYRTESQTTGLMEVIEGDCVETDIIFRGVDGQATIQGDLNGNSRNDAFETRMRASHQCTSMSLKYDSVYVLAGSDEFAVSAVGFSTRPIIGSDLDNLAGGADFRDAGVVYGGTGVYSGTAGKSSCDSIGIRAGAVVGANVGYEATVRCTFSIAPVDELSPITLSNAADADTVTTQGGASGTSDTISMWVVYHNNRDVPLTGLQLRVPEPSGVRLSGTESATGDTVFWTLPDLEPDAVADFEFTLRLLSSDVDEFTITPELAADEFETPVRGDPIALTVAQ